MTITFRDDLGYLTVAVDGDGIQFCNELLYFSDGSNEYIVKAADVVEITCNKPALF